MIHEAVITTRRTDGAAHITPLGYREADGLILLAPFVPSQTLENLRRHPEAVLNFTTDVRVMAGALTGRRDWPVVPASRVAVPRLAGSLAHLELRVLRLEDDPQRPRFWCEPVHRATHAPFCGFNRAQSAVLELAILVSRLDWLPPEEVREAMTGLARAIEKTAGPAEREAWGWLAKAVAAHPRHCGQAA
jgi:hypothetical protein